MAQHNTNISATWDVGVAIKRLSANPLDLSLNHASEAELKTYAKDNVTAYVGLLVNVVDSNGNLTDSYIIKDKAGNLKKLASDSDLSALSGVFKFKGVAEAINLDQSIITIKSVITAQIKDKNGKVTKDSETLYCVATAYEFDMDVYYGWGTSLEDIRFWTDTTTVTSGTTLYGKGALMTVAVYKYNDKLYYPLDEIAEAPIAGDDEAAPYESIDGDVIYVTSAGVVYASLDTTKDPIGAAVAELHTCYDFTPMAKEVGLKSGSTSDTIVASPDNSGYVYQIGENEYASNGQIWVKLGSPVEDWIIL